jgi:selenide,water dikinase
VELPKEILAEILQGGYAKAQEAGCLIIGGHTVDDKEPKYGLAVVGLVEPGKQVTNAGAMPGDVLVLTKPLGTGIITTAGKGENAPAEVMDVATRIMATLNRDASEAMMSVGVHACTDVTGFGLLGHLNGMVAGSRVGAQIRAGAVPVLPGVLDLLHQGYVAGGTQRNLSAAQKWTRWHPDVSAETQILLCDAQTSGGLLIALPPERVDALLDALRARGAEGTVIGEMTRAGDTAIDVIP